MNSSTKGKDRRWRWALLCFKPVLPASPFIASDGSRWKAHDSPLKGVGLYCLHLCRAGRVLCRR